MPVGRKPGFKHSPETKEKMILKRLGKTSPNKGINLSQKWKDNISESNIGITRNAGIPKSEEHKQKLRESLQINGYNIRDEMGRFTKYD